jgi:hypothetical protein
MLTCILTHTTGPFRNLIEGALAVASGRLVCVHGLMQIIFCARGDPCLMFHVNNCY